MQESDRHEALGKLTERQRGILGLICQGHTYAEIGDLLRPPIAERTVKDHAAKIFDGLGIRDLERTSRYLVLAEFCSALSSVKELVRDVPATLDEPESEEPEQASAAQLVVVDDIEQWIQTRPERGELVQWFNKVPVPPITDPISAPAWWHRFRGWALLFAVALGASLLSAFIVVTVVGRTGDNRPAQQSVVVVVTATVQPSAQTAAVGAVGATPSATAIPRTATAVSGAATRTIAAAKPTYVPVTGVPIALTDPGTVLAFGETWIGDGLRLTTTGDVGSQFCNTAVDFNIENASHDTLNFEVPIQAFTLELSTGQTYSGTTQPAPGCLLPGAQSIFAFNDLRPTASAKFQVPFAMSANDFQAFKRSASSSWYGVQVKAFNARISHAEWRADIVH